MSGKNVLGKRPERERGLGEREDPGNSEVHDGWSMRSKRSRKEGEVKPGCCEGQARGHEGHFKACLGIWNVSLGWQ